MSIEDVGAECSAEEGCVGLDVVGTLVAEVPIPASVACKSWGWRGLALRQRGMVRATIGEASLICSFSGYRTNAKPHGKDCLVHA